MLLGGEVESYHHVSAPRLARKTPGFHSPEVYSVVGIFVFLWITVGAVTLGLFLALAEGSTGAIGLLYLAVSVIAVAAYCGIPCLCVWVCCPQAEQESLDDTHVER